MLRLRLVLLAVGLSAVCLGATQVPRPLPDQAVFLAEAKEKLASDERLQVRYTYKLRRTEVERNPFGRIGSGDTVLYEVYPSPILQLTYYRRIAVNGVSVSAPALAEQDRKQREKVDAFVRTLRRESAAERDRRLQEASVVGRRERAMVEDVVAALDYKMDRREILNDRSAIIVAFTPKPAARPWSDEGKLAMRFKGQVWIDEESRQVARVEAQAIDAVSFGLGFLLRIYEGTRGVFTRRPMSDGIWLPADGRLTGTGRALLFRRFDFDFVTEYFDYRPIDPAAPPAFVALPDGTIKD